MKNINKYIIAIVSISMLMLSSCQDTFDIVDEDTITEEAAFRNVSDLQLALFGAYATYSYENIIDLSNFTDDTKIGRDTGGQKVNFHDWQLNEGTGEAAGLWLNLYTTINRAARILAASEGITPEPGEEALYNQIRGECNTLIALAHYNLLSIFAPDFSDGGLGVPYIDFVAFPGDEPARNTVGEVVDGIKDQLQLAAERIPASQTDVNRFNRDFVTGLRAKVALLEGDLTGAINFSQNLINAYPLANQEQYTAMWFDEDETEVIQKLDRVVGDFPIGGIWYFTANRAAFIEMSNSIYDIVSSQPDDIRFPTLVDIARTEPENNFHLINKYPDDEANPFLRDIKLMRVSEMYLVNAEARALNNDFGGAAQVIKQLRDARFGASTPTPTYGNVQSAIVDILRERRIELAYEGHRYVDVKRLRSVTNQGFERAQLDCGAGSNNPVQCNLPAADRRFTFPIPLQELNGNGNIVQNPGY